MSERATASLRGGQRWRLTVHHALPVQVAHAGCDLRRDAERLEVAVGRLGRGRARPGRVGRGVGRVRGLVAVAAAACQQRVAHLRGRGAAHGRGRGRRGRLQREPGGGAAAAVAALQGGGQVAVGAVLHHDRHARRVDAHAEEPHHVRVPQLAGDVGFVFENGDVVAGEVVEHVRLHHHRLPPPQMHFDAHVQPRHQPAPRVQFRLLRRKKEGSRRRAW